MQNLTFTSSLRSRIWFLVQVLSKYRWLVARVLLLEVVISLLGAVIPYFTKLQVDQLQTRGNLGIFALLLLIPLMIELVRMWVVDRFNRQSASKFDTEVQLDIEKYVWQKLDTLDAGFFDNKRNQRILYSTLSSTRIVNNFFRFIKYRLGNITTILAIIPLLGFISWPLLIFVSTITFLQVFLNEISRKQEFALSVLEDRQKERFWKIDQALTNNFHILKVLGASDTFVEQYIALSRERDHLMWQREESNTVLRNYESMLGSTLMLGASLMIGYQVFHGELTIGTFTLVIAYTMQLNGVFRDILNSMREWRDIGLQFDRLQFFFMLRSRTKRSDQLVLPLHNPQKIVFQTVYFTFPDLFTEEREYLTMMVEKTKGFLSKFSSYHYESEFEDWKKILEEENNQPPVLKGVNLQLEKGKIVALLGRNGAGKTTITHLSMHHYEPNEGSVFLDGHRLYEYDQNQLVQQFGIIQQSPFILERFSIRENLLLGMKQKIDEKELWQLLEELDIKKVIAQMPKQLDTVLGEGANLSGGQEQLLAVARVLLQKRPFLIFDEGMNQMDIEHETKVVNMLKKESKQSGILFITHRITTARKADYIYMLNDGKIAEEGTHDELLARKGLYSAFWNMQVIE